MSTTKRPLITEGGKLDLLGNDLRRPGVYLMVMLVLSIILRIVIDLSQPGTLHRIGSNLYRLCRLIQDGPV